MRGIDRLVDFVAHIRAHVRNDLPGEAVARIVHGQHNAMNRQSLIEGAADLLDCRQKLRQAFEREELALQRDDYSICGGESVDGQKVERRRAINHKHR